MSSTRYSPSQVLKLVGKVLHSFDLFSRIIQSVRSVHSATAVKFIEDDVSVR